MRIHTPAELQEYGVPAPIPEKEEDPWRFVETVASKASLDDFKSEPERINHLYEHGRIQEIDQLEDAQPVFSFVHLSDVQLRDERARLWTIKGSDFGDLFLPFEHNEMQMRYDYAVYLSAIFEINALRQRRLESGRKDAPQFVVHTGDSLEAATSQELIEFLAITDQFQLPFLQAIGNHDVNVFGNFEGRRIYLGNPMAGNLVINGADEFALWHRNGLPTGPGESAHAVETAIRARHFGELPLTDMPENYHPHGPSSEFFSAHFVNGGFQSGHGVAIQRNPNDDDNLRPYFLGYYGFSLRRAMAGLDSFGAPTWSWDSAEPVGVRIIVLNTYETIDAKFGSWHLGRMSDAQLNWLSEQIQTADAKGELALVFGHHDLGNFADKATARLLETAFSHQSVIAYFAGHTHQYDIREHDGFWEIVTAGLVEYPQRPSIVTLQKLTSGKLAIDIQALEILPFKSASTSCIDVDPTILKLAALCGKAGAEQDLGAKNIWDAIKSWFQDSKKLDVSKRNARLVVAR